MTRRPRRAVLFVLAAAGTCLFETVACTPATLHAATESAISAADASYMLAIEVCDAKEKAIIARQGSTELEDLADMAKVRASCDAIFAAFEQIRRTDLLHAADVIEASK